MITVQTLLDLAALLRCLIELYTPIIPTICLQATQLLNTQEKAVLCTKLEVQSSEK